MPRREPPVRGRELPTTALLAASIVLCTGCARTGPPGGGPPDSTPPVVEATLPADGETRVDASAEIRITFSEEMDRVSVERAFSITPSVGLRNFTWDGASIAARPADALPDSTTFSVGVAETAQDYHGVAMETPLTFSFSTGETIDTGSISGLVVSAGEPVAGATVWACRSTPRPDGTGKIRSCTYQDRTEANGTFFIGGVRASETPYTLFAFVDLDGDGVCSVDTENGQIGNERAAIGEYGDEATGIVIDLTAGEE